MVFDLFVMYSISYCYAKVALALQYFV